MFSLLFQCLNMNILCFHTLLLLGIQHRSPNVGFVPARIWCNHRQLDMLWWIPKISRWLFVWFFWPGESSDGGGMGGIVFCDTVSSFVILMVNIFIFYCWLGLLLKLKLSDPCDNGILVQSVIYSRICWTVYGVDIMFMNKNMNHWIGSIHEVLLTVIRSLTVADAIVFALIVDLFLYSNAASGCKQLKHDKNIFNW